MNARVIRIGNSRGIRLPRELLENYGLQEGDEVELERRRQGILIRRVSAADQPLPYAEAYREMALEVAETAEWEEWDTTSTDGDAGYRRD